jgi:Na+/proline symporter
MKEFNPTTIAMVIGVYFVFLYVLSWFTSRKSDNDTFFRANKNSPWLLIAIGMIGSSLSGVTFISIPGVVGMGGANQAFSYMQMVFGYMLGYFVIATVLMPIYYRYNLTSIYGYLESRLGVVSYKSAAAFFIISRLLGSALRLYLVAIVLHEFLGKRAGVPFYLTVFLTIAVIWLYTNRGGIKTIVVTDVMQTVAMIAAVVLTIHYISSAMDMSLMDGVNLVLDSDYSRIFFFDQAWADPNNFFKQFLSGALIALVMTGLDQDMMQKNLTCRTLGDAQKNVFVFSIILIISNFIFLTLGALLFLYADANAIAIPSNSDYLYPMIALEYLPEIVGVLFILGLVAAAYSSADSALAALTTSFCVDFLDMEKSSKAQESKVKTRKIVHIAFALLSFIIIIVFQALNNDAVINGLFKIAGYTYGPILGLFAFSILTSWKLKDKWVWVVCLLSPILSYWIDSNSQQWFNGFSFGFLNILLNGWITFMGLWVLKVYRSKTESSL